MTQPTWRCSRSCSPGTGPRTRYRGWATPAGPSATSGSPWPRSGRTWEEEVAQPTLEVQQQPEEEGGEARRGEAGNADGVAMLQGAVTLPPAPPLAGDGSARSEEVTQPTWRCSSSRRRGARGEARRGRQPLRHPAGAGRDGAAQGQGRGRAGAGVVGARGVLHAARHGPGARPPPPPRPPHPPPPPGGRAQGGREQPAGGREGPAAPAPAPAPAPAAAPATGGLRDAGDPPGASASPRTVLLHRLGRRPARGGRPAPGPRG